MNDPTQEQALWAIQGVETLHDAISQFLQNCGQDPTPTSKAQSELTTFENPESIQTAYSQGNLHIEYADDHLMAFVKAYSEPAVTIAPFTCVRTLMETAATSIWVFDETINASTRVKRSIGLRLKGLKEQRKFLLSLKDNNSVARVKGRIQEVEQSASAQGFSRKDIPQMGSTELIARTLNEESNYRLLSSFAHGHDWAVHQLSFQPIRDNLAMSGKIFEKEFNPMAVIYLCHLAARAFAKPVWSKSSLFGFDLMKLGQVLDDAFAKIGIGEPSAHFWHRA